MTPCFSTLLAQYQPALGDLGIDASITEKLVRYLDHLWRRNQDLNLVSRKMSAEALVTDHLLDSLIALPHFPEVATVADLGTGGGFPAVPLALCRPNTQFLLFEKSPLKCNFLRELAQWCTNLDVKGALLPENTFPAVDVVCARGFKSLRQILNFTKAHHQRKGSYILYKARRARIEEELGEVPKVKARIVPLTPYGDAQERHLVCLS